MSSKWIRIFFLLIVTFPMLFYAVEVNAMNTGFQTESITNDNQETFTSYDTLVHNAYPLYGMGRLMSCSENHNEGW